MDITDRPFRPAGPARPSSRPRPTLLQAPPTTLPAPPARLLSRRRLCLRQTERPFRAGAGLGAAGAALPQPAGREWPGRRPRVPRERPACEEPQAGQAGLSRCLSRALGLGRACFLGWHPGPSWDPGPRPLWVSVRPALTAPWAGLPAVPSRRWPSKNLQFSSVYRLTLGGVGGGLRPGVSVF